MSVQRSFSRVENDLLPKFRENMGLAESTEDVRKFFGYTMAGLMEKVFEGRIPATYGDIRLAPGTPGGYALDHNLTGHPEFSPVWEASDLSAIIGRFATAATNRFRRLEKNPDKTEAKMYPTPDRVGKVRQP